MALTRAYRGRRGFGMAAGGSGMAAGALAWLSGTPAWLPEALTWLSEALARLLAVWHGPLNLTQAEILDTA
eukprot:361005-Chlamydomonas_euryale.AAC.16